ncbi:MAG: hypothetical protein JWN48_1792 [Myxococcaceae bacterium]|nr:hypothetical protein [Myxococcaceae bacterium]
MSCRGSGELPTDYGLRDCPDCGGSGQLPSRAVLTAWRCRDLQRQLDIEAAPQVQDVRWLLTELDVARTALNEIIALAHDLSPDDPLAFRIRMQASAALGLYEVVTPAATGQGE